MTFTGRIIAPPASRLVVIVMSIGGISLFSTAAADTGYGYTAWFYHNDAQGIVLMKATLLPSADAEGCPQLASSQRETLTGSWPVCFQNTLLRSTVPDMGAAASRFTYTVPLG
jgi:hypothetical protein